MMTGSYFGFLLNAGQGDITRSFLTRPGTGWTREHSCTRRVSRRYRYGYRMGDWRQFGKNRKQFQSLHTNVNEPIGFFKTLHCKVSLLVVHHIGFHGLEPLSRQKIAPQKKSLYNSTFAGFSYIFVFVMHGGCPKFLPATGRS